MQAPAACGLTARGYAAHFIAVRCHWELLSSISRVSAIQFTRYTRPLTSFYAQDTWSATPNLTVNLGVRYEIDQQPSVLHTSYNNFAPRVSFAWDPFNDKKTVIRAGYGIFYSPVYGQIADVAQTLGVVNGVRQIAQVFVPLTGVPGSPASLTSAAIFQTLFAQGKINPCTVAPGQAACVTAY